MYIFNPDNDIALANFGANYTPPSSALKMASDLAILPLWYAPDGSKIITEKPNNKTFFASIQERFQISASLISFSEIANFDGEKIVPWGWNPALRKKLLSANVSDENLPSICELEQLRAYSGRQHAVKMLRELKFENDIYCGESHLFTNIDDVLSFLAAQSTDCVLKMPNSGSGKGLMWINSVITDKQTDWCRRVIREQRGVIAEPVLNKVQDFAMEFFMENGKIGFEAYSLFRSSASGAYQGNVLMSATNIEKELSGYVSVELLHQLRHSLQEKLLRYFPFYNGCIGVDMMICETSAGYHVQPCVEINMRMNMGMVAHIFFERFIGMDKSGWFAVDFFKQRCEAQAHHRKMRTNFPLIVKNGKIESGYLNLTPVLEDTSYVAWANVV